MFLPAMSIAVAANAARALMAMALALVLAACSFGPAYGPGAGQRYDLAFASPATRLEQIVYQDLVARFGRSADPDALQVQVRVSNSSLRPGQRAVGLTARITIVRPDPSGATTGQIIYEDTRTASSTYEGASQSLANQQASTDAAERAATQLAEAVRLTLLGELARMQRDGTLDAPFVAPVVEAETGVAPDGSVEVPAAIAFQ